MVVNKLFKTQYFFIACMVIVCAIGSLWVKTSIAFKPNESNFGHKFITRSIAENGYKGWGAEVPNFFATLSDNSTLTFTADAVDQLELGVRAPDFTGQGLYLTPDGVSLSGEPFVSLAHCDDELITSCSERIKQYTIGVGSPVVNDANRLIEDSVVNLLILAARESDFTKSNQYATAARLQAGRALHTLQDFYAHSNWSDMVVSSDIFTDLGFKTSNIENALWDPRRDGNSPLLVSTCLRKFCKSQPSDGQI
jgi:hypothetical protein